MSQYKSLRQQRAEAEAKRRPASAAPVDPVSVDRLKDPQFGEAAHGKCTAYEGTVIGITSLNAHGSKVVVRLLKDSVITPEGVSPTMASPFCDLGYDAEATALQSGTAGFRENSSIKVELQGMPRLMNGSRVRLLKPHLDKGKYAYARAEQLPPLPEIAELAKTVPPAELATAIVEGRDPAVPLRLADVTPPLGELMREYLPPSAPARDSLHKSRAAEHAAFGNLEDKDSPGAAKGAFRDFALSLPDKQKKELCGAVIFAGESRAQIKRGAPAFDLAGGTLTLPLRAEGAALFPEGSVQMVEASADIETSISYGKSKDDGGAWQEDPKKPRLVSELTVSVAAGEGKAPLAIDLPREYHNPRVLAKHTRLDASNLDPLYAVSLHLRKAGGLVHIDVVDWKEKTNLSAVEKSITHKIWDTTWKTAYEFDIYNVVVEAPEVPVQLALELASKKAAAGTFVPMCLEHDWVASLDFGAATVESAEMSRRRCEQIFNTPFALKARVIADSAGATGALKQEMSVHPDADAVGAEIAKRLERGLAYFLFLVLEPLEGKVVDDPSIFPAEPEQEAPSKKRRLSVAAFLE